MRAWTSLRWRLPDDDKRPARVECARCGKAITFEEAVPEEGDEWECRPCNERCNAAEKAALLREDA